MRLFVLHLIMLSLLSSCETSQPTWCEAQGDPDTSCAGPHCVAAVVVDYLRLEPRGFKIFSLSGEPLQDSAAAEALALAHLQSMGGNSLPDQIDCDESLDFYNCFLDNNEGDSWLIVIHAPSSSVLFAGLEVWATEVRGEDLALPPGYENAVRLGCSDGALDPEAKRMVTTGGPLSVPPTEPAEAWAVAQRLNLTEQFTKGHTYRVMVVSYAPATGEFDPKSADWLVWIHRD